eukprot:UN04487
MKCEIFCLALLCPLRISTIPSELNISHVLRCQTIRSIGICKCFYFSISSKSSSSISCFSFSFSDYCIQG